MFKRCLSILVVGAGILSTAWYKEKATSRPFVTLDYGSFRGRQSHVYGLEQFFGIPFAESPVGSLRFRNPIPPSRTFWNHDSTKHGPICPQQSIGGNTSSIYNDWFATLNNLGLNPLEYFKPWGPGQEEDCLNLDITRPAGLKEGTKLPVMFSIFAGGFELGASWQISGLPLVKKSVEIGLPVIWVSANYRTNAFGFLSGREVGRAGVGNLGLKDQRLAMKWVQKYIERFGGDPNKVTLYGISAGAISISHQLLAFEGKHDGLFRAAICQSGTALPVGSLSEGVGQKGFDYLANNLGCQDSPDKLDCLREVDSRKMQKRIDEIPGVFSIGAFPMAFGPAVDDEFVTESMQHALAGGRFAKVPLISGNVQDEGTVLTISSLSLQTEDHLRTLLTEKLPKASPEQIEKVLQLWPSDPRFGSPFGSGNKYALTSVYKQYAAMLGDFAFQGLRRLYIRSTIDVVPTWSYLDRAAQHLPILGAFHASELPAVAGVIPGRRTHDYQARWISFAHTLDPNFPGLPHWETYKDRKLLVFDKNGSIGMDADDFRQQEIDYYLSNIDDFTFGGS